LAWNVPLAADEVPIRLTAQAWVDEEKDFCAIEDEGRLILRHYGVCGQIRGRCRGNPKRVFVGPQPEEE
jgi:hypothetical protein